MEKIEISGVGKWLGRFKGEREGVEMDLVVPSEFRLPFPRFAFVFPPESLCYSGLPRVDYFPSVP